MFGGFDYFRAMCRFSRLLSKAQSALFTISATLISPSLLVPAIDDFELELEKWKQSIPEHFRPGSSLHSVGLGILSAETKLKINFQYYSSVIALARLKLSVLPEESSHKRQEAEQRLLHTSRAIIDLTRYIDLEAYTPVSSVSPLPIAISSDENIY
jgi:hypothetical protein